MQKPEMVQALRKLANAGEEVGFTLQQMIDLLNAGLTLETLLHLIEWRSYQPEPALTSSSRWIM